VTAIYRMVQDVHPPFPDDISPELADFLKLCFKKEPADRPTARVLRNHPWMQKHVPDQSPPAVLNVDEMRRSIKRYTLDQESGSKLRENLAKLKLQKDQSSEEEISTESPISSPIVSPKSTSTTVIDPPDTSAKQSTKKGSLFRKKKDKRSGSQINPDAPMILNIYSVEQRRNIFAFTIYNIRVVKKATNETWEIERTWSDFKELHTQLSHAFPNTKLPSCPQKKFWGVMDPDFVRKRWQELQNYLLELTKLPDVLESEQVTNFLAQQK